MLSKLQRWGNSQGLRLSKQVLEMARVAVGDEVEILVGEEEITIRKPRGKKYDLAELVSRLPPGYRAGEEAFGKPTGKEEW